MDTYLERDRYIHIYIHLPVLLEGDDGGKDDAQLGDVNICTYTHTHIYIYKYMYI